jgi:hypothetical protein
MRTPTEQELLEATRHLLRESERACDELTVARLRAARLRALDAKRSRLLLPSWRTASGFAAAGVVAVLAGTLWFGTPSDLPTPRGSETAIAIADIEMLATTESPEFYTDIEFYDWLATEPDAS